MGESIELGVHKEGENKLEYLTTYTCMDLVIKKKVSSCPT